MKTITIRNIVIGQGMPKIIVPIVGTTEWELLDEVNLLKNIDFDVIEWRVDHFNDVENIISVKTMAEKLHHALPNIPILFTFRTTKEGGTKDITTEHYIKLNQEVAATGLVDLIDIEAFTGDDVVKAVIKIAHEHNVRVVASNHDFHNTPNKDEIIHRLRKMQDLGADIPKIAVMPQSTTDVLTLLAATSEMVEKYADRPIITMSMGGKGAISRIAGETFGSSMTFGAAKNVSAPGQLNVQELRVILDVMHRSRVS